MTASSARSATSQKGGPGVGSSQRVARFRKSWIVRTNEKFQGPLVFPGIGDECQAHLGARTWGLLLSQEITVAMPIAKVHKPMSSKGTLAAAGKSLENRIGYTENPRLVKGRNRPKPAVFPRVFFLTHSLITQPTTVAVLKLFVSNSLTVALTIGKTMIKTSWRSQGTKKKGNAGGWAR